jgi:hypothetical protein
MTGRIVASILLIRAMGALLVSGYIAAAALIWTATVAGLRGIWRAKP